MPKHEHRVIALVEDGAWRVKDTKDGTYLFSKEPYDEWHQALEWKRRDDLTDEVGWAISAAWGANDDIDNGRAARALATLADTRVKRG